ncbi:MAG: DegT/DnrJ/EryC1/StrS family aminotransferase [Chitinophagales bacterium]|nr:DegT/DnrJ/EryC1/StrS family aminotransferase [Chitinophagales bacterium]
MRKIEMVDLKLQYQKIKTDIDLGIQEVLDSAAFIGGKPIKDFATELQNYLGVKHVIPCANGTDALQIAMMALDLQPGDEVICPSFTYFATVEVVALLKLTPVFIDVNPQTFNIEASEVEKAISPKTKAIVPVHLYGQCAEMEPLLALGRKHNIPVIEDNAQGIGGEYFFADGRKQKTGGMGLIGTTSFFPSKNLGCYGDGGAITTNDDALAEKLIMIANHGQRVRYYHDMIGVNSRLDTIQAAILRVKLKQLDHYIDARRSAAAYYDRAFANHKKITTPFRATNSKHVFHQYTLVVSEKRNELVEFLKEKNIPAMIYYPVTCHQQKAFHGKGKVVGDMKNTLWLSERVVSLPMHTELDEEQLRFITDAVLEFSQ